MHPVARIVFVTVAIALAAGAWSAPTPRSHVVVISLDGFPADQFWDARASLPVLRTLASEGAVAGRLGISNPTLTWSNHSTLMTGVGAHRHGIVFNGLLVRVPGAVPSVNPRILDASHVRARTILDAAHEAGLRTAAINWPATKGSASIDDNFPDSPDGFEVMTPRLRQELTARGVLRDPEGKHFKGATAPARDEIWLEAACQVIAARQPHLLLLHLLNTDGAHHKYGAGSYAGQSAVALADQYVGRVLRTLKEAGLGDRSTVFVVSDHGFQQPKQLVYPNVILRQAGWLKAAHEQSIHAAKAFVISAGGSGAVYLDPSAEPGAARALFEGKAGIAKVLGPSEARQLGWPMPADDPLAPDLILVPGEDFAVSAQVMGDDLVSSIPASSNVGYHGYLADRATMDGIFVAWGRSIKRGTQLPRVVNRDLAPTVARLLNLKLPDVEGHVIEEFLVPAGVIKP